ncbi:MAG TPA: hypothetical protein VJ866_05885 [Pyrinomonadaceae bacterium]|nr:hypothetical protein [Pyrinomonadaceae bacterium]
MDDKERNEWLLRLQRAFSLDGKEPSRDILEPLFDEAERRLSSFKELCGRPFGLTAAEVDRAFPGPLEGKTLDFPCLRVGTDDEEYRGVLSLNPEVLFHTAGHSLAEGFINTRGYPGVDSLTEAAAAGDERAQALLLLCERYFFRPAFLYVVLRMTQKIDEAIYELTEESAAALSIRYMPEMLSVPAPGDVLNLPPARRPSKWAEQVRARGDKTTRTRLEPFAPARPTPSPDDELIRAVEAFRRWLKGFLRLESDVDDETVREHLSRKGLAEASGLSASSIQRYVAAAGFKNFTDWKKDLFS